MSIVHNEPTTDNIFFTLQSECSPQEEKKYWDFWETIAIDAGIHADIL